MKKGFGRAEAYGETEQQLTEKKTGLKLTEKLNGSLQKLKLHIKNKTKTNIQ